MFLIKIICESFSIKFSSISVNDIPELWRL